MRHLQCFYKVLRVDLAVKSQNLKLLIIEDEPTLAEDIADYFSGDGDICETAADLRTAKHKIGYYDYDCIILDIGLPDGSGLEVLKYIREVKKEEGVLVISARNSLDDKLNGLNLGADDYLVKPFHLAELRARIAAVFRRKYFNSHRLLEYDGVQVDLHTMETTVNGHAIVLTRKEYDMLVYFIANRGRVVSRNALAEHLWADEVDLAPSFDFIYTHIKNIRKKLLEYSGKDYFKSIYGIGYKFG